MWLAVLLWCFCISDRLEAISLAWKYQCSAKACCRWPFPPVILLLSVSPSLTHSLPLSSSHLLLSLLCSACPHDYRPHRHHHPQPPKRLCKFCLEVACPLLQTPRGYPEGWNISACFSEPLWQIGHFTVGSVKAYEYLIGLCCWWACVLTTLSYLVRIPELYHVPPSPCPQKRHVGGGRCWAVTLWIKWRNREWERDHLSQPSASEIKTGK